MVKSTSLAPEDTTKGMVVAGLNGLGVVSTKGKGRWRGHRLSSDSCGRNALVDKDEGPTGTAFNAPPQHHQIGRPIAVDIAGEYLTARTRQTVAAFENRYAIALADQHHQRRPGRQVAINHGQV